MAKNFFNRIWYKVNPKHKDRLFCRIFGREKYKKYALSLYNAVNGTNYHDLSKLEIITLEDAIYIKMKNDVAYLMCGTISLFEHQSSINPNMPVRGFMYMGELYSKLLKQGRDRIYNNILVKIPTPQYIVFYNGTKDCPEKKKLRLSDAFINPRNDGEFEFTATVININPGNNSELLDSCSPLKGYSILVKRIRENVTKMPLKVAVDKAVTDCIRDDILSDILREERSSVMLEMLSTFDEKLYEEGLREEGRAEERQKTESEKKRADAAEAELAKYKDKYGEII